MKKLIIAMILCMVGVGFVECSSNNDDEPTEQYNRSGTCKQVIYANAMQLHY